MPELWPSPQPGETAVVTGGAGFLGTPVVRRLLSRGCRVIVLDDLSVGSTVHPEIAANFNFEFLRIDLRDASATTAAIVAAQPQIVIHLAALHFIPTCVAEPSRTLAINVLGTQNVLDGCAQLSSAPIFVMASTADIYRPDSQPHDENSIVGSDNVYGISKYLGEQLVTLSARQGRCRPVICRLFNLYGPGETNPHVVPEMFSQLRQGNTVRLGNTEPKRDFVYTEDAAEVLCAFAAGAHEGVVVNIGTGSSHSVAEVLNVIRDTTGRHILLEVDPLRYRVSDRPNLQNNPAYLRSLLPGALSTTLQEGMKATLQAESLLG